jgi:pyruvate formate lyase activating enzyme
MGSGTVFNIMRYSTQDGPGLRTTVFLKGCPLNCLWCHNPESIAFEREFVWRDERCLRCAACVDACPEHAVRISLSGDLERDANRCTWCGACLERCGSEARTFFGEVRTVGEVMADMLKDRDFYEETGGGVTFSGGEPLAQVVFLEQLLQRCRDEEIHTTVDTSGAVPWRLWERLVPLVDLWLYDVKCIDEDLHRRFTGASNAVLLGNLRRLAATGAQITVRIPVIPGFNDEESDLAAIADFVNSVGGVKDIVLLPYHTTGAAKYELLGRDYALANVIPPSATDLGRALNIFAHHPIPVTIGGNLHE